LRVLQFTAEVERELFERDEEEGEAKAEEEEHRGRFLLVFPLNNCFASPDYN
jgi:hypothetical protein